MPKKVADTMLLLSIAISLLGGMYIALTYCAYEVGGCIVMAALIQLLCLLSRRRIRK